MTKGRCFRVAYVMPVREDRRERFVTRDPEAAAFITDALRDLGYSGQEPIYHYPGKGPDLRSFDDTFLRENDVVQLHTRPPIHDKVIGHRRAIQRSYTNFEEKLFKVLSHWFYTCSRSEIVLTDAAAAVSPEIAQRQTMEFFVNGGAMYKVYGSPYTNQRTRFDERGRLTPVFLVYQEHAWPGGPAFLAAFGMGGVETLVWCYKLATEYRHLLCTTPFLMGEMMTGKVPARPEMMRDFADSWEVKIFGPAKSGDEPAPRSPAQSGAGDRVVTP